MRVGPNRLPRNIQGGMRQTMNDPSLRALFRTGSGAGRPRGGLFIVRRLLLLGGTKARIRTTSLIF